MCGLTYILQDRADYSGCTTADYENSGYYSIVVDDVSYWSHCGFPNPRYNHALCGRISLPEADYKLCDPDDLISTSAGEFSALQKCLLQLSPTDVHVLLLGLELEVSLDQLISKTPYQCTTLQQERMNFILFVVLVANLQSPDLSDPGAS